MSGNNHAFSIKPPNAVVKGKLRTRRAFMLFGGSAIYGLLALLMLMMFEDGRLLTGMAMLYCYGMLGVIGIYYMRKYFMNAEESHSILAEVLQKSLQARVITTAEGETIYTNAAFQKLIPPSDIPPSLYSLAAQFDNPPEVAALLSDLVARSFYDPAASLHFNLIIDGRPIWLQVTCQKMADSGHINWRIDDVTERHRMQIAIEEEREKLRDFTDNAPVGFYSVDQEGVFQFANDTFLRMMEMSASDMLGKIKLHDIIAKPEADTAAYDITAGSGSHKHIEIDLKNKQGRTFQALVHHSISKENDGKITGRAVVYDLTEERQIRAALRETQDRFERLFDEAPVGICMLSSNGRISDVNIALANMLKEEASQLLNQSFVALVTDEQKPEAEEWIRTLLSGQHPSAFLELVLRHGKVEVPMQIFGRKVETSNDVILHFIDQTEHKNLEKQVSQSQKMQAVGQLAGGIAHDFNNLLTAMIGFCDLLLLKHKPGDPSFADIMQIKQNANRAASLVRQLLAFSRQQTLQPRVLDMTDVLSELSHLLRRLIGANIELNLNHAADLGLIKADQGQMDQVLINLVVNARDAMPQGGKLDITTKNLSNMQGLRLSNGDILPPGRWVATVVTDTGTGIPSDVLPRIFEPFFSTKDVGAGTGLGLATVHGIVHQTGGYLSVDSVVGTGTTFTIYLPRHTESADEKKEIPAVEEKAIASDLTGSARILLVEDEDAVRTFSTRALNNKGYQVVDASSAEVALKLMEDKKIDPEILITDVMMPEMDGTTLAKIVREKYPHVKIIFISGYAEDRFKEHLGAHVWFLPKPFTLKQLATKVKEVIDA